MSRLTSPSFWKPAIVCVLAASLGLLWVTTDATAQPAAANSLQQRLTALEAAFAASQADLLNALERVMDLEDKLACVHTEAGEINGLAGPHVIIEGCNLHVRNTSGATTAIDGKGNLIVGYNEPIAFTDRTGSHNLVVGLGHTYSSYGGFVAGENNAVAGAAASVSGGIANSASGQWASVSGGDSNTASGVGASVSGGEENAASGSRASVSGGADNTSDGNGTTVSGGLSNHASGDFAGVSGGRGNFAGGQNATVSGGEFNHANGESSTVSGGETYAADGFAEHVP